MDAVVPSRWTSRTGGAAGLSPTLFMLPPISWAADTSWGGRHGGESAASALSSGLDDSDAMMRLAAVEVSNPAGLLPGPLAFSGLWSPPTVALLSPSRSCSAGANQSQVWQVLAALSTLATIFPLPFFLDTVLLDTHTRFRAERLTNVNG